MVAVLGVVTAYANIEAEVAKLLVAGGWADEMWVASMVVWVEVVCRPGVELD